MRPIKFYADKEGRYLGGWDAKLETRKDPSRLCCSHDSLMSPDHGASSWTGTSFSV